MAGSVNKVILVGRVGKPPEVRSTQAGKEIASFSLATSETWKDKSTGERKEKTEWHNISVFNEGLVKVIKNYVTKGAQLYIEGTLQTRKWQDREGNDRYTTEVVLAAFGGVLTILSSPDKGKTDDSRDDDASPGRAAAPAPELLDDSEIPF